MSKTLTFLTGVAVGAGVMYMMDPDRGGRRRALARDQVVSARHSVADTAQGLSKDARNRAQGMAHEMKGRATEGEVDDRVLEERVRSEIGHVARHAGAVQVTAMNGTVTLSGPTLTTEVQDIVRTAKSVRGVKDVRNMLDVHEKPGDIPSLQG